MKPGQMTSTRGHFAAPSSAISSIVCGPSHSARPNTDWKVAVREPIARPRRDSRAATVWRHSAR